MKFASFQETAPVPGCARRLRGHPRVCIARERRGVRRRAGRRTTGSPEADLAIQAKPTSMWTGIWTRQSLLGDMGGIRPWLGKYGATLQITETSEYLANLRGGLNRGGAYDGLTTATLTVDTQKAIGLPGGTFNVSALQIHGTNLSARNLGTLNTASGIEAQGTTRLWSCGTSSRSSTSAST